MRRSAWSACLCIGFAACSSAKRSDNPDASGACDVGTARCDGNSYEVCQTAGWKVVEQCPLFCAVDGCKSCESGNCMTDACMQTVTDKSYIGCEYWAVDLDNATEIFAKPEAMLPGMECSLWPGSKMIQRPLKVCYDGSWATAGACDNPTDGCPTGNTCVDSPSAALPLGICGLDGDHAPFAIVVSNPQPFMVAVTISNAAGQSMTVALDPVTIQAIYPQALGFADQSVDGTGKTKQAYKLTSTAPVVAYQFNPLNNVDVFSNDASLLLPRTGFDVRYFAVSYTTLTRRGPNTPGRNDYHGFVTVVAWDDNTQIEVTPTANTIAGRDGTPALVAGQTQTFTLDRFEVLNLEAVAGPDPNTNNGLTGGDLTGTLVHGTNTKTFGVFGGHEAVRIEGPLSDCCADHLEEMMFPTATWGKNFAIARTVPRRDVPDILRVVAGTANTQVTFTPQAIGGPCPLLQPGQHCDVTFIVPTEVTSTQPITVAHLMQSAIQGMTGTGDPSLGIVPPVEQFRKDYKFLAPMDYDQQYVDIVAMAGDDVRIDDTPLTVWTAFGAGRVAAQVPLTVGPHTVSCALKCSVEVYGWSQAVSYLFAGGLDLHTIVIEKPE